MASMQTRSGVRGRPPPKRWVLTCGGMCIWISSQRLSGMRQSSGTALVFMSAPGNKPQLSESKGSCTEKL
jgi:hypothetical protein